MALLNGSCIAKTCVGELLGSATIVSTYCSRHRHALRPKDGLVGFLSKLFGGKTATGKKRLKPTDIEKRFDLRRRSGQGSMSKVWQAYDRNLGRGVCLKILDK